MECPRLATVEMCCLFAYTTDGCGHERRGVGGGWVGVGGGGGNKDRRHGDRGGEGAGLVLPSVTRGALLTFLVLVHDHHDK